MMHLLEKCGKSPLAIQGELIENIVEATIAFEKDRARLLGYAKKVIKYTLWKEWGRPIHHYPLTHPLDNFAGAFLFLHERHNPCGAPYREKLLQEALKMTNAFFGIEE